MKKLSANHWITVDKVASLSL